MFSRPLIANGDTGKGSLSRGDAHVMGHPDVPMRWRLLPRGTCQDGSNTSNGHNFGKYFPIWTKLGWVMYVYRTNMNAP